MSLYTRQGRVRGTLFPADAPQEAPAVPRVLRGADARRATPADAPLLVPRVLRGASAQESARPFEVVALDVTPQFKLPEPEPVPVAAAPAAPAPPPAPAPDEDAIRADEAAQWQARMEEAALRARENGYRQGRADAERANADERALLRENVEREMAALQTAWQTHLQTSEMLMAQLAFEVAETILGAPLPDNVRRVSSRALHEAVESLSAGPVQVTIHPVDLLRLQETGIEEEMRRTAPQLRIESNPYLNEGDWHVETEQASVRHVRAELLDALRRRLGLLALGKS